MLDQAAAGGTNVLCAVLAAKELDPHDFGIFGIVLVVYLLATSSIRALVSEPALVLPAERYPGAPLSSGLVLGVGLALGIVATGVGLGGDLQAPLIALAALIPLLLLQDIGRYLGFAQGRPDMALRSDLLWLALQLGGFALLATTGTFTVTSIVLAWGGAGATAGAVAVWVHRSGGISFSLQWVRSTWGFSWRYLVSYGATFGIAYVASFGLAIIVGAPAVGEVTGAQLLLSPVTLAVAAAINLYAVQISRRDPSSAELRRAMAAVSLGVSLGAALVTFAALLVPARLGRIGLGANWPGAHALLLPAGAQVLLIAATAGPKIGMTGVRAVRESLALNLSMVPVILGLTMLGAVAYGTPGFFWGLVLAHVIITIATWVRFLGVTSEPRPPPMGTPGVAGLG